jgi:predicted lipoprotein with Yx(FWY)xxD motif
MKRKFGLVAALLTFALIVAACGGSDDSSASKKSSSTATTSARAAATTTTAPATTTAPPATTAPAAATVKTASTTLGDVVVDANGRTLYAFANDQGTTSACTGGCAGIWPPLMATGTPTGGTGIDATKLSAAPSGQVVYGGHLLYLYAQDMAAGDTKGQGVGGIWHVVAPSGDIIT